MKPPRDSLVGATLDGRYQVVELIARGGMATVYRATDLRLDRDVAVKVMHPHLADDPQFVARFHREAKAAARMAHPNAVAVFDQGQQNDIVYLVMEFVPGTTLRDLIIDRGALTPGETLEVLEPLLDALAAAHRAGLVHRDIKPENVLITGDGRVKVADFGLARAMNVSHSSATTGMLLGTFAYLSPEQVTRGVADARSDIYAVGIVTFEMLTGRQPFAGALPGQVLFNNVSNQVPAPSSVDPGLPLDIDELVTWATARDPDLRPRDAAELSALVRRIHGSLSEEELDREPELAPAPADPHGIGATPTAPQPTRVEQLAPAQASAVGPEFTTDTPLQPQPQVQRESSRPHYVREEQVEPDNAPKRRTGLIIGLVVALLVAVGGLGWFFTAGPGAYTTTPTVTGSASGAKQTLAKAGLSMKQRDEYSESVAKGDVIRTDPRAGQKVHKGGTVNVFVSVGSAYTEAPKIIDYSPEGATKVLKEAGLELGETTDSRYSDSIAKGNIVSQDPKSGERVKFGSSIAVVVSKGPQPIDVPSVVGKSITDATSTLEGLGLKVDRSGQYDDNVAKDNVISQDPNSGTVYRGDTVKLVVSDGPQPVPVPNVINLHTAEATAQLQGAGFQVDVKRILGGGLDTVRSQDPSGGTAPKGSTITITVV